jgi:hypothetical protein
MAPMHIRVKVALTTVVLSTVVVSAQQPARVSAAKSPRRPVNAARPVRHVRSLINGVAVNSDRTPVPNASVRLRNLAVNAIELVVTTNEAGEFTFSAQPDVAYICEIADSAGRTLAVGDVILPRAGEVVGATVSLPSHVPPTATVFNDSAAAVMSAAARAGIQVVDPQLPKVSPRE